MWQTLLLFPALVLCALAFLENAAVDKNLDPTSSIVKIDKTDVPLEILCSYNAYDHSNVDTHLSLTISKRSMDSTEFHEIVRLTDTQLKEADDFVGTATGELAKESYLRIEISHPTQADAGEYKCHSVGLTQEKRVVGSELTLTVRPISVDSILECIKGKTISSLVEAKQSLVNCGASLESWFQTLRQVKNKELSGNNDIWGVTDVFNSSSFYIFTAEGISKATGKGICAANLGYLAEINTENEFIFLNDALNIRRKTKEQMFRTISTGAYWESIDGPVKFSTHPGDSVYTGHWAPGEPHLKQDAPDYKWLLLLDRGITGVLTMADGIDTQHYQHNYLCEISKDID